MKAQVAIEKNNVELFHTEFLDMFMINFYTKFIWLVVMIHISLVSNGKLYTDFA